MHHKNAVKARDYSNVSKMRTHISELTKENIAMDDERNQNRKVVQSMEFRQKRSQEEIKYLQQQLAEAKRHNQILKLAITRLSDKEKSE